MRTPAGAIDVCGSVVIAYMPISCIDTHILYNILYNTTEYCTAVVSGTVHAYFYSRLHTTVI